MDERRHDDKHIDLRIPPRNRSRSRRRLRANSKEMAAQYLGQPSVKGSTETMRMMLLTFSLVGLQYVS